MLRGGFPGLCRGASRPNVRLGQNEGGVRGRACVWALGSKKPHIWRLLPLPVVISCGPRSPRCWPRPITVRRWRSGVNKSACGISIWPEPLCVRARESGTPLSWHYSIPAAAGRERWARETHGLRRNSSAAARLGPRWRRFCRSAPCLPRNTRAPLLPAAPRFYHRLRDQDVSKVHGRLKSTYEAPRTDPCCRESCRFPKGYPNCVLPIAKAASLPAVLVDRPIEAGPGLANAHYRSRFPRCLLHACGISCVEPADGVVAAIGRCCLGPRAAPSSSQAVAVLRAGIAWLGPQQPGLAAAAVCITGVRLSLRGRAGALASQVFSATPVNSMARTSQVAQCLQALPKRASTLDLDIERRIRCLEIHRHD